MEPIALPSKHNIRCWIESWAGGQMKGPVTEDQIVIAFAATELAADRVLTACCEWIATNLRGQLKPADHIAAELRAAISPRLPSPKKQALADLIAAHDAGKIDDAIYHSIYRALV
jgi:hypothetical protein